MSTYIVIVRDDSEEIYGTNTLEEIEQAQAALRDAGLESAEVHASPLSIAQLLEGCGDPDGYKNGHRLFATDAQTVITIGTNDEYYGAEVVPTGGGVICAEWLSDAVLARWPQVTVKLVPSRQSLNTRSSGPLAEEITDWIDANWERVIAEGLDA